MKIFGIVLILFLLAGMPLLAEDTATPTSTPTTQHKSWMEFRADLKWGAGGADEGMFMKPAGLWVDPSGNIYVADDGNKRVQKFDGDGKFITAFGDFEPYQDYPETFDMGNVTGLAVDKDGNMYFHTNLEMYGFSPAGKNLFAYRTGGNLTSGYFISRDGFLYDLFESDQGPGGNIYKRNRRGKNLVEYPDNCSDPRGVALDSQGNIYVVDGGVRNPQEAVGVQKYSPTGDFLLKWGKYGQKDSQFHNPVAVAVDGEDHIYVLDGARIKAFTPDGKLWRGWGQPGVALGEMRSPMALGINSKGQVYVLDAGNNRVQRFTRYQIDEIVETQTGKVLKKKETALTDTLPNTTVTYDPKSDPGAPAKDNGATQTGNPAPSGDAVGKAAGDAAKKILGF